MMLEKKLFHIYLGLFLANFSLLKSRKKQTVCLPFSPFALLSASFFACLDIWQFCLSLYSSIFLFLSTSYIIIPSLQFISHKMEYMAMQNIDRTTGIGF